LSHCFQKLLLFEIPCSIFDIQNIKRLNPTPSTKSQGVREEKQKTETSAFVIWVFYSSSTPKQLATCTGKAIER